MTHLEMLQHNLALIAEPPAKGEELARQFVIWREMVRICQDWLAKHGIPLVDGGLRDAKTVAAVLAAMSIIDDPEVNS